MNTSPIKERIREAFEALLAEASPAARAMRKVGYHELFDRVFPRDQFPRAGRGATKGGPPGASMAFGKALRALKGYRTGEHSELVYLPADHGKRTVGEWLHDDALEALMDRLDMEGHKHVHVDRRRTLTFVVPHVEDLKTARVFIVERNGNVEEVALFPPTEPAICEACGHGNHENGGLGCAVIVRGLRCGCGAG